MDIGFFWLLLPLAAASGWYVAHREYARKRSPASEPLNISQDYYKGLNYLLSEQPDKAIEFFSKLPKIDNESIEIHMALGGLFRRRGEVDRAIRIHRALVDWPELESNVRNRALQELARDYMSAGLLDRAENLCLELIDAAPDDLIALHLLQDIYQQEKEWFRAIEMARKISAVSGKSQDNVVAQYYCELTETALKKGDTPQAYRMLSKALQEDGKCARAVILQGNLECEAGSFEEAIETYQRLSVIAPEYLSEVIEALKRCYLSVRRESELVEFLKRQTITHHSISLLLSTVKMTKELQGNSVAVKFLQSELEARPSLKGIQCLLELDTLGHGPGSTIRSALDKLLANKASYQCSCCGFSGHEMHWCCPSCKRWSSMLPIHDFQGNKLYNS